MKLTLKCCIIIGLFNCFAILCKAQLKCRVEHFTTEDGLSHDRVTSILKSQNGFLWAGSWDGLNRFDGRNFIRYNSRPGDSSILINDRIDKVLDDNAGNLWIQAFDRQFCLFDQKREQFNTLDNIIKVATGKPVNKKYIKKMYVFETGLAAFLTVQNGLYLISTRSRKPHAEFFANPQSASNTVNFVHRDSKKRIWVGSEHGIWFVVAGKAHKQVKLQTTSFAQLNYTDFAEDDSNLYFSTQQGKLVVVNKSNYTASYINVCNVPLSAVRKARHRPFIYCTTETGAIAQINLYNSKAELTNVCKGVKIQSVYEDRSGALWLEPATMGVIRFLPGQNKSSWFTRADGIKTNANYYNIFEDNAGRVWVNVKNVGFGYFDPEKNRIENFYQDSELDVPVRFPEVVYSVLYDDFGMIWLSTKQGIVRIIPQNLNVSVMLPESKTTNREAYEVRGLTADHSGKVWVGTKTGQLYRYENGKMQAISFSNITNTEFGAIYSLMEDSNGNIWIGTKDKGLFKAIPTVAGKKQYELKRFTNGLGDAALLCKDRIDVLFESSDKRLWAGTYQNGLFEILDQNGSLGVVRIKYAERLKRAEFQKIRYLNEDTAHNLWLGTTEGLIIISLKPHSNTLQQVVCFQKQPNNNQSLGDNDVQHIYRDAKGSMWLATAGGGLCKARAADPFKSVSFRNYTKADGLPSDYILSTWADFEGNLWLATQNGLSRFNPVKETIRNYTTKDGVFLPQFSEASVASDHNGDIFVGTVNGLVTFDPQKWDNKHVPARIAFTKLQINNTDVPVERKNSILRSAIDETKHIRLAYNQNTVSLDFTLLDYIDGNNQNLQYRLIGLNDHWQNSEQLRRATYTNLPPGSYIFEIKTTNNGRYNDHLTRSLRITVNPPFWQTWWAYLIYVVLVSWLVVVIFKTANTILKLRQSVEVERKLATLKVDFFTNVSHELRTPLTLILNPLRELMEKESFSNKGRSYINIIYRNAERLRRFMDQWLELRKIENGKGELRYQRLEILDFIRVIGGYFDDEGNDKNIELHVTADFERLDVIADPEKLDVLIYNILANAIKFSPPNGLISIHIAQPNESGIFKIIISDQGIGLPEDKLKDIFQLYFVDNRQNVRNIKGTGIGLALAREIAELHQGNIYAQPNTPKGLSVIIELPVQPITGVAGVLSDYNAGTLGDDVHINTSPVEETDVAQDDALPLLLLVEDSHELRSFLTSQLSAYYRVKSASNGKVGLQMAVQLLPDIVVSDVMMPEMDGIEMLDRLKTNQATSHIPVILLTAKSSVESQLQGLKYGADHYFSKPFHKEILLTAMANLIKQRRQLFDGLVKDKVIDLKPGQVVITSKDEVFLKNVIRVVENGMADADFNVDMVADAMSMARATFYKKFKSLTDVSMSDFIRDMRLERAKQLIDAGENRISTVAYMVGFNNPKYLSTCFKDKFNITPTDYLKSVTTKVK